MKKMDLVSRVMGFIARDSSDARQLARAFEDAGMTVHRRCDTSRYDVTGPSNIDGYRAMFSFSTQLDARTYRFSDGSNQRGCGVIYRGAVLNPKGEIARDLIDSGSNIDSVMWEIPDVVSPIYYKTFGSDAHLEILP